ncbi:MAG: glycosyltransferase family 39 protein [Bacteroidales bacterium]|nr:glycosyltransferase family 39 protein [Bacteroidales bacterium]
MPKLLKIALILIIAFHGLLIAAYGFYYFNTGYTGGFMIFSEKMHSVTLITPVGGKIACIQAAGDTLITPDRPIRNVFIADENGVSVSFHRNDVNGTLTDNSGLPVYVSGTENGNNRAMAVFSFLMEATPVLKAYIFLWGLVLLAIAIGILLVRRFRVLMKHRVFRWLVKAGKVQRRPELSQPKFDMFRKFVIVAACILLLPATYLRLGKYPFSQSSEERKRALVSLEMKLQNSYIAPTLNGDAYYNKPPLFNWFLLPVMGCDNVEFATRAVSATFLLLSGVLVFVLLRRQRGGWYAASVALLFMASYHVIMDLSLLLNLDALFSLLIIPLFYLNYRFADKRKFYQLFITGYLLTSLAFMTKGFPALWYQGVSLFGALAFTRNLKMLFSKQHLVGLLTLICIPGLYYIIYSQTADGGRYIARLFYETQIVADYRLTEIVKHFIAFPSQNMIAFFPMALLAPVLLLRRNISLILRNREQGYLLFVVITGSLTFAISPYYLPYYCMIFVPLVIDILLNSLIVNGNMSIKEKMAVTAWMVLFLVGWLVLRQFSHIEYAMYVLLLLLTLLLLNRYRLHIVLSMALIMVLIKLLFPVHTLYADYFGYPTREECRAVVANNSEKPVCVLKGSEKVNYTTVFYLSYFSNRVIRIAPVAAETANVIFISEAAKVPAGAQVIGIIHQSYWTSDASSRLKGKNSDLPVMVFTMREKTSEVP